MMNTKDKTVERRKLEAKVGAVNMANFLAIQWQRELKILFADWKGKKVVRANGMFVKKLDEAVRNLIRRPSDKSWSYRKNQSKYTVSFTFGFHAPIEGLEYGTMSAEQSVTICEIDSEGTCVSLSPDINCRTNYTADEIEQLRVNATDAKKAYDKAISALYPFGEYNHS